MNKKLEVLQATGTVINTGNELISKTKDFIACIEILLTAATSLKEVLSDEGDTTKQYTFQEVRGIMASLAGNGKKEEARALLKKYNANRLSEVKEDDYNALVAEAEVLLND